MEPEKNSGGSKFAVPAAIIIAGVLIAGAVIYSNRIGPPQTASVKDLLKTENGTGSAENPLDNLKPISSTDHIRGNPNAPVKLVEFSDPECPFCKRFHSTLTKVLTDYGDKVVWVYRHFPLEQLHSKAPHESQAFECANELGGNDKFWAYLDRLFEITPSNDGLDPAELPKIAQFIGLDMAAFNACLSSGKFASRVENDYQDAIATGGSGTPYTIVIAPNGDKSTIVGALPYATVKAEIDKALAKAK